MAREVRLGLVGSGFVAGVHLQALREVRGVRVTRVASRDPEHGAAFAQAHGIPAWDRDWRSLVQAQDVDAVLVLVPNDLHANVAMEAIAARKHVLVEKPMALTLEEADAMIAAARAAGVWLGYGEQLCFAPKYERLRELAAEGAFGRVYHLRQAEKHSGPHSPWFWDVRRSGGGALMDMGCHAFGWFRWVLGARYRPVEVLCRCDRHMHRERTEGEDHALALVTFADASGELVTAQAEESWAKPGGMDDRAEIHGTGGVGYADLLQGSSNLVYSEAGYGYSVEKAGSTRGWSFALPEEVHQQGYPHELQDFVSAIAEDRPPRQTGEDGRAVLELLLGAYRSAGRGAVERLPLEAVANVPYPAALWRPTT